MYCEFSSSVTRDKVTIPLRNQGNVFSRPKIIIEDAQSSVVKISLNGVLKFQINFGSVSEYPWYMQGHITIDTDEMVAYIVLGEDMILMNRIVDGDYEKFIVPVGNNEMVVEGDVGEISIEQLSRWI